MSIGGDDDIFKTVGVSKVSLPFYELPHRKTSAEIINEARLAIRGKCFASTQTNSRKSSKLSQYATRDLYYDFIKHGRREHNIFDISIYA